MWRSWVDRINTTTTTTRSEDGIDTYSSSGFSSEELKRRRQLETQLQDSWRQCEDLLSSEQERSDLFLFSFLPKFCGLYGNDNKPITAFPAVSNERAFMGMLSRHLLAGIRKVPEQKTKAESSKALMNSLRSKWHLYYIIKAMYIISCGPTAFLSMMQQQRIPSVITKIFRSFIDLPPAYYDTSKDPLDNDDMVSLDDTGSTVADILEQLVGNSSILRRLIVDDTFFTIMRLVSTKPAEWDTQDDNAKEPAYMIWKHKTVNILKSVDADAEVIQYMHSRRYVEMLIQTWKDGLKRPRLTFRDYADICLDFNLINHLVKTSIEMGNYGLYDELQQADAYQTLLALLITPWTDDDILHSKAQLVSEIVELAFVGKRITSPTITDGLPYQHDDFVFPRTDSSKGKVVQNISAMQTLLSALLYPSASPIFPSVGATKTLPPQLQTAILHGIQSIIQKNPVNFFLIERTNILPLLIETMENYQLDVQDGILDILDYVMLDINFVPLKELAVLSLHLQNSNSSGALVGLICRRLTQQLQKSPKLRGVARESGLLNMLSLLLSKVNECLNEAAAHEPTDKPNDSHGSALAEVPVFVQRTLTDFDTVVKCLVEMTKDPANMTIFRKLYNGNIFDLLHYPQTRMGALQLFEALSSHENGLLPTTFDDDPTVAAMTTDVSYAFSRVMEAIQDIPQSDLAFRLEILKTIKRVFSMYPSTRDVFRLSGGYVSLVSMIVAMENVYTNVTSLTEHANRDDGNNDAQLQQDCQRKQQFTELLEMILFVLMESMRDNDTNRRYFTKDIGYEALENALMLTGALTQEGSAATVFGVLFAFMVQDEGVRGLFTSEHANVLVDIGALDHAALLQHIDYTLNNSLVEVCNPEMALTILHFQQYVTWDDELANAVLLSLYALARGNRHNQIKLNRSGLILRMLQRLYPRGTGKNHHSSPYQETYVETQQSKGILIQLIKKLITMGIGDKDLRYLFRCFGSDGYLVDLEDNAIDGLLDLIIYGTTRSRWPNFIQFNLLSKGDNTQSATSLETPALENFPPPSPGYTMMMWLHVEEWDRSSNITVWTLWDDQRPVLHVYLDALSGNLHIHSGTSKTVSKFDSFTFKQGFWYHIGLVHHKSRLGASLSTITLYVNGVWMEQVRCTYIAAGSHGYLKSVIGGQTPDSEGGNDVKYINDINRVANTSTDIKRQRTSWDLGPTYLLVDTLDADVLNLYFHLGARYKSLYQDSLRQFQTYDASTALFLNLRGLTKRREINKSVLANVMRGATTSSSLPENKIVLAIIAGNALAFGSQTGLTLTGLNHECLRRVDHDDTMNYMILNTAIPKITQALYTTKSMCYLTGNPGVGFPFGLDESIWKIGGCAICLNLIQRSETSSTLIKSTQLLVEIIQYSWRNSDDMERCHGYEILANILKQKRDLITVELLEIILQFVGKNSAMPEESAISNPYAYRSIILNFEVWKKTSLSVQRAHLDQFILFMETSNKYTFNLKRLLKVHLVKKMLLAFRMNIYAKELIPNVVQALKVIVLSSWTTENIRAIATFLASNAPNAIVNKSKVPPTVKRSRLPRSNSLSISTGKLTDGSGSSTNAITDSKIYSQTSKTSTKSSHMCNIVMEMLHDILCLPGNQDYVHKFSLTITSKWPLLFFAPETDPYTVVLACRILVRLFYVEGSTYTHKFGVSSEGFLIMSRLLSHFWNLTQLYETLTVFLMGLDIATYPVYDSFDMQNIRSFVSEKPPSKSLNSPALSILIALCREGSRYHHNRKTTDTEAESSAVIKVHYELLQFLDELYKSRNEFREACNQQDLVDDMSEVLFPILGKNGMGDAILSTEEELRLKEESSNFDDLCTTPSSATTSTYSPIDGKMIIFNDDQGSNGKANTIMDNGSIIKRGGTLALVTKTSPHLNKKSAAMLTRLRSASWSQRESVCRDTTPLTDAALTSLLQFLVDVSVISITDGSDKNLTVLAMVLNSYPPSTLEAQMKFESYLLTYISQNLKSTLQFDSKLLNNNIILINVSKFCQIAADAVLQGRFINGAEQTYDLLATILESLHSAEGALNRRGHGDQTMTALYRAFNRMVLLKISDLEQGDMLADQIGAFLNYCIHHQKIILSAKNTDQEFLRSFCYHLYQFLLSPDATVNNDALNVWKLLLLQKPEAVANIFKIHSDGEELLQGFSKMLEMDQDSFFVWVDSRKIDLNLLFKEHIYKSWENVILQENKYSRETWKNHQNRRVITLKRIQRRQLHEADIYSEYVTKTAAWSKSIHDVEMVRFTKALQDNDGHENFIRSEWTRISSDLTRERAIWGPQLHSTATAITSKWALDFTEGRYRVRKKIRCISDGTVSKYLPKHTSSIPSPSHAKISEDGSPLAQALSEKSINRSSSEVMVNKTITEVDEELTSDPTECTGSHDQDGDDISKPSADVDENQQLNIENDDDLSYEEDKNQKVLRLLDPGDMVVDVYNVSQIEGLDAREGLLLLCKDHMYLVDNFFQRADGEVVEIWDVPKHERDEYLLLLAQAAGMETEHPIGTSGDLHTCRKWANTDLREVFKRRFLFRDVALELFFADGQNALITVEKSERDDLFTKLANRVTTANDDMTGSIFGAIDKESNTLGTAFKLTSIFGSSTLHDLTHKWERREITNFQYLMYINAIAGRSYNDLTQYPVFPWILADYTSEKLDLIDPKTFRDLTKPMGAQTPERRAEFQDRYRQWGETNDPAPAFHYGTHYSSAMIVCSFLIRLEPFTQHYLKLQGGTFDHADRLFDSVGKAWESASEKNMGDVRELIPEFFCLPEFLENVNKFNFGVKQGTGESIDSVTLPPWASGDPKIFIQRHREALESEHVSQNLHHWIDLIFGYKQQGKAAIDSLNVFHHVSYEGAVDLDSITDIVEKTATIGIINNFGQTPRQLFKKPHPVRCPPTNDPLALGYYPLRDHLQKFIQSVYPLRDLQHEIGDIGIYNDRLGVTSCQQLFMVPDGQHYIEWGFSDNSLRLFSTESRKLVNVFENFHNGFISSACFPDTRTLITGGTDSVVCAWKIERGKQINFELQETLRGHTSVVTSISASRSYSIIVTGSQDKSAIIWDLNRLKYVRSLPGHDGSVHLTCINDATGDIITCSGNVLRIWTINGDLYLAKSICPTSEEILSCVIYDAKPNEWSSQDLIITGHQRGVVKFWEKTITLDGKTGKHQWTLNQVYQLQHINRMDSSYDSSDIVSLALSPKRTLLTGNRHGQVYAFVLPDTSDNLHYLKEDRCKECTQCRKSFSVLERKSYCRGCGGMYCLACISNIPTMVPDKSARFCKHCQGSFL